MSTNNENDKKNGGSKLAHQSGAIQRGMSTWTGAAYWKTPQGRNVGCPYAETEEEAGAAMGLIYDPLPDDE